MPYYSHTTAGLVQIPISPDPSPRRDLGLRMRLSHRGGWARSSYVHKKWVCCPIYKNIQNLSLVLRPYLSRGKGSDELGLNSRLSFYGACRLGHAKLGSDWSVWLHRRLTVEQSWDLIGLHYCVCDLAYTATTAMLHSCGRLVVWQCQSCDLIDAWKFLSAGPRILPKFTRLFSSLKVGSGHETNKI